MALGTRGATPELKRALSPFALSAPPEQRTARPRGTRYGGALPAPFPPPPIQPAAHQRQLLLPRAAFGCALARCVARYLRAPAERPRRRHHASFGGRHGTCPLQVQQRGRALLTRKRSQVVSNKMMKSVTVAVTRLFRHTRLGKTIRETKKYMVRSSWLQNGNMPEP